MNIDKYGEKIVNMRLKQDYDLVVAITGEEGDGKSVCAIQLAKATSKAAGLKFSLIENEIYSPTIKEITNKISNLPRYGTVILDEAIKVTFKQDWFSQNSRYLSKFVALCRKENKCMILCIPKFTDLNTMFRNHRVKLWIHVIKRGLAVVLSPDRGNILAPDHWHTDANFRLLKGFFKRKKFHSITSEQTLFAIRKTQLFVTTLEFDDITPEEKTIYETERDKSKYEDISKLGEDNTGVREQRHMLDKGLLISLLKYRHGYTTRQMADLIGVGVDQPNRWEKRVTADNIRTLRLNYNNNKELIELLKELKIEV